MKEQIDKQAIEEMAKVIKSSLDGLGIGNFNFTGDEISTMFAKALYNAGYRKQGEGEWIIKKGGYYQRLVCSVCEKLSIATFDYCPNCGAHMRGGAE